MTNAVRTISIVAVAAMTVVASARAQSAMTDTTTRDFVVDHVHVILHQNTANDVVAANIYLLGGTRQITENTAGIEALMLAASEDGTRKFSKQVLQGIIARTGATITIEPSVDWTTFALRTLRQSFDSSWAVFADRLVAPRLEAADVERARRQMLADALEADADPDNAVQQLAEQLLYANHPYRLNPDGTPTSLQALTASDIRRYHDTQVVQSRLLVVVVGNINVANLERAVRSSLTRLPVGSYTWTPPPLLTPSAERVSLLSRDLPTNYILGYYPGPRAGTPDFTALRVATAVLSGRLFAVVRSQLHLSYAVDAPLLDRAVSAGGLYVTTTDPTTTLNAMANEVQRLQTTLVDPEGLQTLVGQFITDYFLKNETNGDQASFLARTQLYDGDYRDAGQFVQRLREVTPDDVRRVAEQYMHDMHFGFVGDTSKVPPILDSRF